MSSITLLSKPYLFQSQLLVLDTKYKEKYSLSYYLLMFILLHHHHIYISSAILAARHVCQILQSSNLSSLKYGHNSVVATTQASINGTMLNFRASRQEPLVKHLLCRRRERQAPAHCLQ